LEIVSSRLPAGVWLTSLSYKDNGVTLEGIAFTNNDIVSYVDNLKTTPDLTEVYLDESRQAEVASVSVYRFRLNFKVRG
ncbi:MAG: PilN domain-containing protein, partial [Nitrospirales bacterium]|nr:PilN domain-containing protein [Nitrospirales bacterium]